MQVQEQGNITLEEAISCASTDFPMEKYQEEEDAAGKVTQLSRIVADLKN